MQVIIFIRKDLVTVMNDFSKLISDFFIRYLSNQKNASENTIKTYRDAFVLLLEFMKIKNIESNKLKISDFNYDLINEYLDWLESDKKVSVSTRNNRLAAIKSFFRYVSYHRPEYMTICTSILEIHKKKSKSKPMNYLTIDALTFMIASFDQNNRRDLRDLSIILLLYESGARVSELTNVKVNDLKLYKPSSIVLYGKGKKVRIVPLDYSVIEILIKYIDIYNIKDNEYLFFNSKREKLSREGVNYILQKHFKKVKELNKTIFPSRISPHCIRHSKAMHLLENGVNLIYIRDILGHSSVTTTEIYSKVNPEIKRKHLLKAAQKIDIHDDYNEKEKNDLLEWLKSTM